VISDSFNVKPSKTDGEKEGKDGEESKVVDVALQRSQRKSGRGHGRALKKADPWLFGANKSVALGSLAAAAVLASFRQGSAKTANPQSPFHPLTDRHSSRIAL